MRRCKDGRDAQLQSDLRRIEIFEDKIGKFLPRHKASFIFIDLVKKKSCLQGIPVNTGCTTKCSYFSIGNLKFPIKRSIFAMKSSLETPLP